MSCGNIGYTRMSRYKERVLNSQDKKKLNNLETELENLQRERDTLYENIEISDKELKDLENPIQLKIDKLISDISNIKWIRVN